MASRSRVPAAGAQLTRGSCRLGLALGLRRARCPLHESEVLVKRLDKVVVRRESFEEKVAGRWGRWPRRSRGLDWLSLASRPREPSSLQMGGCQGGAALPEPSSPGQHLLFVIREEQLGEVFGAQKELRGSLAGAGAVASRSREPKPSAGATIQVLLPRGPPWSAVPLYQSIS